MRHHGKFAINRIQIRNRIVRITIAIIINAHMSGNAMKRSIPHSLRDLNAISDVRTLGEGFIQSHAQQIDAIIESTYEEVHLNMWQIFD